MLARCQNGLFHLKNDHIFNTLKLFAFSYTAAEQGCLVLQSKIYQNISNYIPKRVVKNTPNAHQNF